MVSTSIKIKTLAASLVLIIGTELLGWWIIALTNGLSLAVFGLMRVIQIAALTWIVIKWEKGLAAVGWAPGAWNAGLAKGAVWSLAFGAAAAFAMAVVYLMGKNPLLMLKSPLPSRTWELALFFAVGGVIAPVAEELCFRGILYSFFRRWGILTALATSTVIFVMLHTTHGLPLTQIVGGIVFAMAYETSGNLTVPITIHCLGNLAIFTLSLVPADG
jgi:membrane protease YdiL (CAAX protease family)